MRFVGLKKRWAAVIGAHSIRIKGSFKPEREGEEKMVQFIIGAVFGSLLTFFLCALILASEDENDRHRR